jgi:hypothetical protein
VTRAIAALPPPGAVAKARDNIERVAARRDANVAEIRKLLDEARVRLRDRALNGTDADAAYARRMIHAADDEIRRLDEQLRDPVAKAYRATIDQADADALAHAQEALGPGQFAGISGVGRELLDLAAGDSADLVKQINDQLRTRLNRTFRAAATGSVTPEIVAQQIGGTLLDAARPTGVFGTVFSQMEKVHRTEVGRLYQAANEARMERVATDTGLKTLKRWVKTRLGGGRDREDHLELNGATIPLDEHFNVGAFGEAATVSFEEAGRRGLEQGEPASGPLDPALSAEQAVNCTCSSVTVLEVA